MELRRSKSTWLGTAQSSSRYKAALLFKSFDVWVVQIIKSAKDPEHPMKAPADDHEFQMILEEEKLIPWNKVNNL